VRRDICHGLNHLGITLDEAANATNARRISTAQSPCGVEVVATNEELIIARHSAAIVNANAIQFEKKGTNNGD